ncbi:MAG TPA: DUF2190 family protein [Candidatus Brocadiia bacterium]|nr:DUF2190 family protein [Candidatus Brocadiia bacterium]
MGCRSYKPGDVVEYTPSSAVTAGTPVDVGGRCGIPAVDVPAGAKGAFGVNGHYKCPMAAVTISAGNKIWWDADGDPVGGVAGSGAATNVKCSSPGDVLMGSAVEDRAATDTECVVDLNRFANADLTANTGDGEFLIGDGSTVNAVVISGDAAVNNAGALTIANEAVTLAKMADLARGSIIAGQTGDRPAALDAKGDGKILVGDGTDINSVSVSGDASLSNTGALTIAALAVETGMIANGAVDGSKLASSSITGAHPADVADGGHAIPFIIQKSFGDSAGDVVIYNGNAPFKFRVFDAQVENLGANGANANTVQVCAGASGTNAITDAMSLNNKADTDIVRALNVDDSEGTIPANGSLYINVVKAGGTMGGVVRIHCLRIA